MKKIKSARGLSISSTFEKFAAAAARYAGRPATFLAAVALVLGWALVGPFVGFTDTWQLVINTGTTIITFLMVFLIQHTQNRDTLALQIKLAELLVAVKGADGRLATAEELSEKSLEELHEHFRTMVREAKGAGGGRQQRRRTNGSRAKAAAH